MFFANDSDKASLHVLPPASELTHETTRPRYIFPFKAQKWSRMFLASQVSSQNALGQFYTILQDELFTDLCGKRCPLCVLRSLGEGKSLGKSLSFYVKPSKKWGWEDEDYHQKELDIDVC